jgi:molybdopterin/thiamine biosynthesis adenylyltransferase
MRPKLKDLIDIEYEENRFRFFAVDSRVMEYEMPAGGESLLMLLDGKRTAAEVIDLASSADRPIKCTVAQQLLDDLMALGLIANAELEPVVPPEYQRYARQIGYWRELTSEPVLAQDRLRESTVAILGVGGGGSHIAMGLAAAGVGRLILIDGDRIEESNLNRQTYFAPAQIGGMKTDALAEQICRFNPSVEVVGIPERVTAARELMGFVDGAQLLINCADEPDSRTTARLVSDVGMRMQMMHMTGGGYRLHLCSLSLSVIPGQTPCFTCMRLALGLVGGWKGWHRPRKIPVLGAVSIITANLHVLEALRLLSGVEPPRFAGKWVQLDLNGLHMREEAFARHPLCPWCH